jgi:hypothetical protein
LRYVFTPLFGLPFVGSAYIVISLGNITLKAANQPHMPLLPVPGEEAEARL